MQEQVSEDLQNRIGHFQQYYFYEKNIYEITSRQINAENSHRKCQDYVHILL